MAIISVEEYKALTGAVDDKQDAQIEALIPVVEEDYLMIRNKPFSTKGDEIVYPAGSKMTACEMLSYKLQTLADNVGTSSEALGKHSHSYDSNRRQGYPQYIKSKITSYVRAR